VREQILPNFAGFDNLSRDCDLLPFGSATSGQGAPIDPTLLSFSPLLEALPKVAKR